MRFAAILVALLVGGCSATALSEGNPRFRRTPKPVRTVSLSKEATSRVIQEQMAGFEGCEQNGKGHFISGSVLLQFTIGKDERVERVHVIESNLGSWAIEQCLLQAARFLTFPLPENADRGEFRYPFSFNELSKRITDPKPESWGYASLGAQRAAFNACRTRYGFDAPFHITAYVGATGKTRSVGFHSRKPAPDDFASCVVNAAGDARFPPTNGQVAKYRGLVEYIGGK